MLRPAHDREVDRRVRFAAGAFHLEETEAGIQRVAKSRRRLAGGSHRVTGWGGRTPRPSGFCQCIAHGRKATFIELTAGSLFRTATKAFLSVWIEGVRLAGTACIREVAVLRAPNTIHRATKKRKWIERRKSAQVG